VDRRLFLKASVGVVAGALLVPKWVPAWAQGGLEGEDVAKLEPALQKVLGKGFKDLVPSDSVKLTMPTIAESGANVPFEIAVNLPKEQVKAIHLFVDKNPSPHVVKVETGQAMPAYASRTRMAETSAVRAVVETQDGKLLMASSSTRVTVGGCG